MDKLLERQVLATARLQRREGQLRASRSCCFGVRHGARKKVRWVRRDTPLTIRVKVWGRGAFWHEISTGEMSLMHNPVLRLSPVPERTGLQLAWLMHFYSIIALVVQFSSDRCVCHNNHGSFIYDSPNLCCGPSASVRTGSRESCPNPIEPRAHLTSLISK